MSSIIAMSDAIRVDTELKRLKVMEKRKALDLPVREPEEEEEEELERRLAAVQERKRARLVQNK